MHICVEHNICDSKHYINKFKCGKFFVNFSNKKHYARIIQIFSPTFVVNKFCHSHPKSHWEGQIVQLGISAIQVAKSALKFHRNFINFIIYDCCLWDIWDFKFRYLFVFAELCGNWEWEPSYKVN
jgi:hypothetical protein